MVTFTHSYQKSILLQFQFSFLNFNYNNVQICVGCQLGSLGVIEAHYLSMDPLPGRGGEKKKHWHGRESFMDTRREDDFMINLKDKKLEVQKPDCLMGKV